MKSKSLFLLPALLAGFGLIVSGTASALADVHYVDVNSTNPTPPYISWTTAATNIQDAVDAAVTGDEVIVTNGIYATGGRAGNRVNVDKPLNLRSVNGPQSTIIDGGQSLRCVYLTNSATLSGFTLTNGATANGFAPSGGGVLCESATAVVSNCVVSGNSAIGDGGGASGYHGGTLNNCTLTGNSSGGLFAGGGGAAYCTMNDCTLSGNFIGPDGYGYGGGGGGAAYCRLNNCTLTGNSALSCFICGGYYTSGGGAYQCILNNCTVTGNQAIDVSGAGDPAFGGGVYRCTLNNCSVYLNHASDSVDYDPYSTWNYRPPLTIANSGANVLLKWPAINIGCDFAGFTLQSTTNLGSPVWSTNSPAPVILGGHHVVTTPNSGPQQFYRLVQ